jgi:hypothetical protein
MARYLDEWYVASRREPYHESHQKSGGSNYLGYWSFEAAAITFVLDIDDASYRDMQFYPKDLVDFARSLCDKAGSGTAGAEGRLRALANEVVPKAGLWWSPAIDGGKPKHFTQGDRFPDTATTDYGAVVWYFDPAEQQGT